MASSASPLPDPTAPGAAPRRHIQGFFSRTLPFWLLVPALAVIVVIQLYPAVYSFFISSQEFKAGQQAFVGLNNYQRVFSSSAFRESLWNTLFFLAGYATVTMLAAFVIAHFLNQRLRLSPLYITIIFIPWVLSDVVVGLMFRLFVVPDYGLFSSLFANPGIFGAPNGVSILTSPAAPSILADVPFPPSPALIYLVFSAAWKALPFTTLLILAALQTVPKEVLESASIDGASVLKSFRFITLPLVLPTMMVALFNLTLAGVNGVGLVFSLTGGGPGTSTEVLSFLLYTIGFGRLDFGRAAALSVFMAAINLALILLALRVSRTERE